LGVVLACGVIRALAQSGAADIPRLAYATVDARLFLFALGVSLLTGIVFGTIPALLGSGAHLNSALNEGGRSGTIGRGGRALRNALVVSEVALAVVVLIGARLLIRSFIRLRSIQLGFQPDSVLTMRMSLAGGVNSATPRRVVFVQQLCDAVSRLPGVRSAGVTNGLPLTGLVAGSPFWVEGIPSPATADRPTALVRSVTPDYFATIGVPLSAGRYFTAADNAQSRRVVM